MVSKEREAAIRRALEALPTEEIRTRVLEAGLKTAAVDFINSVGQPTTMSREQMINWVVAVVKLSGWKERLVG